MAIKNQYNTPLKYDTVWRSISLTPEQSQSDAGTFNGITYVTNEGIVKRLGRWSLLQFKGVGGSEASRKNVAQWNITTPLDYKPGTNIKIQLVYSSLTTGTIVWNTGLTRTPNSALGGETETEYQAFTVTANATDGPQYSSVLTYDGSAIGSNESLAIIIGTEEGVAAGGTQSGDRWIVGVQIFYQAESLSTTSETTLIRKRKTPKLTKTLYKSITIEPTLYTGATNTLDGIAVIASSVGVLSDRWYGQLMSPSANDSFTLNWLMPLDYKDGSPIVIDLAWFQNGSAAGDFNYRVGMTQLNGAAFGDEAETEYVATTFTSPQLFNVHQDNQFTFDGSTVQKNDLLSFAFIRGGGTASDTVADLAAFMQIKVRYQSDEFGQEQEPT